MTSRGSSCCELGARQRLFLFHGTTMSAEDVLSMPDSEFTYSLIKEKGVKAANIAAAGLGPKKLRDMGLQTAEQLRELGFDALYLADPKFATEANACFGSDGVKGAFLKCASDAVALAGTDAMHILGLKTVDLLDVCAGAPTEAAAVLQQLPVGISLVGVSATTLLDCGLRKSALQNLGYSLTSIASQTGADGASLSKLGFLYRI